MDLLLIHFPGTNDAIQSPGTNRKRREDTWKQLETAKLNGQVGDFLEQLLFFIGKEIMVFQKDEKKLK